LKKLRRTGRLLILILNLKLRQDNIIPPRITLDCREVKQRVDHDHLSAIIFGQDHAAGLVTAFFGTVLQIRPDLDR
jgi:hypothetical protein